ncbi:MAG: MerR family transcriptional regulator [Bacteroidales bacterium]|nr:MerR family transcriptional regulator [Bacteroidales bacterium]
MQYSIKEIANLTGVNAFTIRIWEKRYNLTSPQRTDTNIRVYSQDDLHKILAVAMLVKRGFKISEVARLPLAQLSEKLRTLETMQDDPESKVNALLAAADHFDEQQFDKILNREILSSGFERAMIDTVVPMVSVLEQRWILSPVFQSVKQFAYDLIRRKIILAADSEPIRHGNNKFLIFSTRADDCEMILIFIAYILKKYRFPLVYAGENISIATAALTAESAGCTHVVMVDKIYPTNEDISGIINQYDESFSGIAKFFVGFCSISDSYKINAFSSVKIFADYIARLSEK